MGNEREPWVRYVDEYQANDATQAAWLAGDTQAFLDPPTDGCSYYRVTVERVEPEQRWWVRDIFGKWSTGEEPDDTRVVVDEYGGSRMRATTAEQAEERYQAAMRILKGDK